jgi:hypothetical protein
MVPRAGEEAGRRQSKSQRLKAKVSFPLGWYQAAFWGQGAPVQGWEEAGGKRRAEKGTHLLCHASQRHVGFYPGSD